MKFNKFSVIFLICTLTSLPLGLAQSPEVQKIYQFTAAFLQDSLLVHGSWSLTAIDTRTGEVLVSVNSEKALAPASCLKVVTSAVALSRLGSDFRFETRLEYDGEISPDGILLGDLYLTGGGDPTLGTERIDSVLAWPKLLDLWAGAVQSAGISQIGGDLIGDDSWFDDMLVPDGWVWVDLGNYYGAGASGLCFNENMYKLFFRPGNQVGNPARFLRTEPEIPDLKFVNQMLTGAAGSGDNGYIYCAPNQWRAWLRGTVPAGVREFSIRGSLPNPAKVSVRLLEQALHAREIAIDGDMWIFSEQPERGIYPNRKLLARTQSPVLRDMVYWLNKRSINLYAEQFLKQLGKQFKNSGSFAAGSEVVTEYFKAKQIPTGGLNLADGSGLSPFNQITTFQLAQILVKMTNESCFRDFYHSLPVAGDPDDPGSLNRWCLNTPAAKNARIKTGLIEQVRSHAGYVYDRRGHLIAFAMIANRFAGPVKKIDKLHEKLVIQLSEIQ